MTRTRVKVCCILSIAEAAAAIRAGADALGLLAAMPDGTGMLDDLTIAAIASAVPPPVASFLLTSRTTALAIAEHVRATRPTAVQIVRPVDPAEVAGLASLEPGVRRVQVIHVEGSGALAAIPAYAPHVHAFILDSGQAGAAGPRYGGTGRTHDWDVSAAFVAASPRPVFLAGGLDAANVGEAIRRVRPFGLDLCSRLRTDGALDQAKLGAFMAAVRREDAEMSGQVSAGSGLSS